MFDCQYPLDSSQPSPIPEDLSLLQVSAAPDMSVVQVHAGAHTPEHNFVSTPFALFQDRMSLCSPGIPKTCSVDQAGFELWYSCLYLLSARIKDICHNHPIYTGTLWQVGIQLSVFWWRGEFKRLQNMILKLLPQERNNRKAIGKWFSKTIFLSLHQKHVDCDCLEQIFMSDW